MPRPKDDFFWKYVEKTSEGSICNFCRKLFKGKPSISRIKYHIIGTENRGISVCEKVPDDARQEARLYADEGANKRQKTMPSSSNYCPEMSNNYRRQCNSVENQPREPIIIGGDQQIGEGQPLSMVELENHTGSMRSLMEQPHEGGGFLGGPAIELHKTEGVELLVTDPVGSRFGYNMDHLWSWLMDDNVLRIGIYGMGGVGKTELAKHINNKLINTPNPFLHVYWIGVSPDFSVTSLQNVIASAVGLSLTDLEDENVRAARLCQGLMKKEKSVLILDNVWNYIDFRRIGIPPHIIRCKLILTTRSLDLCRKIGCQKFIGVHRLLTEEEGEEDGEEDGEDEDWELFKETLGNETILDSEAEKIARLVVKKCEGLPLGIIVIGRTMRKVVDIEEWRCMLEELQRSQPRQEIMEIFETLQLSYNSLNNSTLQQLFLSCAVHDGHYAEDIWRPEEWMRYLIIVEIEGKKSGPWEIKKTKMMLRKLENASLLGFELEGMDCLTKIMALLILRKMGERHIVEVNNKQVKECPIGWERTANLTKVILIDTAIRKITPKHPPRCPDLRVLLLSYNRNLGSIHNSFFEHLHQLQVLDLSFTALERLPNSVSNLVNLVSLLLRGCSWLRNLPSLEKLGALKKLDMSYSGVENVPEGMEFLSNLDFLDLFETEIETILDGILPKLSNLQWLGLGPLVKEEELARLTNLEILLVCPYNGLGSFNTYMRALCTEKQQVDKFNFVFGRREVPEYNQYDSMYDRSVKLFRCHCGDGGEDAIYVPTQLQYFYMSDSSIGKSLCLESKSELKCLSIKDCDEMEYLTSDPVFENLEILDLCSLEKLHAIFNREEWPPMLSSRDGTFSHLRELRICACPSIKNIFPACLLQNLQNLEEFDVSWCSLLEEIVTSDPQQFGLPTDAVILPKLKSLKLRALSQLKSICWKKLICNSLQTLVVVDCPNLEEIPLCLPIQSLEKVQAYPEDWWQRARWENKALVAVTTRRW